MNTDQTNLVLVMPPQIGLLNGFATGLISLANYILGKIPDIKVEILDLSTYSLETAKSEIIDRCTNVGNQRLFVGITATTASYQSALFIARVIKEINPYAIITLGGPHASADTETILRNHSDVIDLIIVGEGEQSLYELLQNYPLLKDVPGAAFLIDNNFVHVKTPKRLMQSELDKIPLSFSNEGLIGTPGKFDHVTYVSARGCPLECAFCAVSNKKIYAKSIPAVVRDVEFLLDMGFSRIAIEDNFFAHSPYRTRTLCEALADIKKRRNGAFAWDCQTRVESLARNDTITCLAKAGCEAVYIGVESFHPEHLLYLNKTKDPTKYLYQLIDVVIPQLLDSGIDCHLNLQFGLPNETVEHERETFEALRSLGKTAASKGEIITIFPQLHVVYPGTLLYRQGIIEKRFPIDVFESFTKWEFHQPPVLFWLGENFAHGTGGIPEGILNPALLKYGKYIIDETAVLRISASVHSMGRIMGIRTFHYGDYIVDDRVVSSISTNYRMKTGFARNSQ